MKQFLKNIFFVSLPVLMVLLVVLEFFFRLIIPAANAPDTFFDQTYNILKYDSNNNTKGVFAYGKFSKHRFKWSVNNEGWNAPFDYLLADTLQPKIAVIGDSYIDAYQLDNQGIYPFVLQGLLGKKYDVYAFGHSGVPLSQYLHVSRYVVEKFDPEIIIVNVVHNDFLESLFESDKRNPYMTLMIQDSLNISEQVPSIKDFKPERFLKLIKKSALGRYLIYNLRITSKFKLIKKSNKIYNANIDVKAVLEESEKIKWATRYLVNKLKYENPEKRILIVMDAPRTDIYNGTIDSSNVLFLEKILKESCQLADIEFISLTDVFKQNYQKHQKQFNATYDHHWNQYGHEVVANYLLEYLK